MPTKSLQLDGPNLEELLARAMNEAGPGGRVASADRVRRGGIAGFFAREHFEVVVEFDEGAGTNGGGAASAASEPAGASGPGTARSFSDLADVTEDVLELTGTPASASTTGPTDTTAAETSVSASAPPARGSEARLPSTQKASFAAMLSAIARDTLDTGDATSAVDPAPDSPAAPMSARTETSAAATSEVATTTPTPAPAPVAPAASAAVGVATGSWIEAIAAATPDVGPDPATVSAPVLAADLFADAPAQADRSVIAETETVVLPGLAALGVPDGLLPEHTVLSCLEELSASSDAQTYVEIALTTALQQLPDAPLPPHRPGSLLVVVGELDRALECIVAIADAEGVDHEAIVVASQARHRRGISARQLVACPEEAADLAERSRRLPHPLLVALHAPVSAEPDRWASRMLSALAPTAVWGVAPATHKSEDLAAWADGLGGLDALAIEDLSATTSPADVLAAGIPIASIDGRHATPAMWAALIAARLLVARAAGRATADASLGA